MNQNHIDYTIPNSSRLGYASMRVLYLEDNPMDADLTRLGLRNADPGFELDVVSTVEEAIARLDDFETTLARGERPHYDLALLDMNLPDGTGLEVLARVRDRSLPLAVVMLTGAGDEEAVMSAIRAGADDYLTKRLDYWTMLPDALTSALQNFRARTELETRPIRLLYVESTSSDIEFLRLHLVKHAPFIRLETLETPEQALARLPLKGPVTDVDVILLDFQLPGMNALDLLKEINLVRKLNIPILISTGQGTEEIAIKAVKLGALDYLVKSPGYIQRLPLAVEGAFYRSQAQRERITMLEKDARLQTIIETEPECVKVVDDRGNLLEMNRAGLAMLEAGSIEEARQKKLIDFISPEYQAPFRDLHKRVMAGETGTLEFEIVGLKGTRRWLETHAAPMRDSTGRVESLLGITRDITERKSSEAHLRQNEKMSAIGQLAGGVAHDFNNQLSAILGYAELLGTRIDDPELTRFIDTIVQAAKRSGELTRNLLTFSRQGQYQQIPIDLHRLIHETVDLLGRSIDKRIAVELRLKAPHPSIIGDPSQIQNALLNLALNARDAMPEGGTLEFATEEVATDSVSAPMGREPAGHDGNRQGEANPSGLPRSRYLHVSVTDTGTGMTEEVKKRIFEPFFTTKPVGKGTGMGLASVFGTVGLHHGTIWVESRVGFGTAIHIHLPLFEENAKEAVSENLGKTAPMGLQVLLVDDEEMLRDLMAEMLRKSGHSPLKAGSGREALAVYQGAWREIDLVILDMVMPGLNGQETLRGIKAVNPAAKVILTSGFIPNNESQSIQELGAQGFLPKPFEKSQLDAMISRAYASVEKS